MKAICIMYPIIMMVIMALISGIHTLLGIKIGISPNDNLDSTFNTNLVKGWSWWEICKLWKRKKYWGFFKGFTHIDETLATKDPADKKKSKWSSWRWRNPQSFCSQIPRCNISASGTKFHAKLYPLRNWRPYFTMHITTYE